MSRDKLLPPTVAELRSWLRYEPETGLFYRRERQDRTSAWNKQYANKKTGWVASKGYIQITFGNTHFFAHRLAWAIYHGDHPARTVDHIDGVRSNNRISNLRQASRSQQNQNRRNFGRLAKGVTLDRGRYRAQIRIDGARKHLGLYDTEQEAHAVYVAAARDAFGEFARLS